MKAQTPLKGRPPKFNPERCAAIISSISKRVPYEIAAEANGITFQTLYNWLNDGERDIANDVHSEKAVFFEAIKKAEEARIIKHMENIDAGIDKWQGQAWILERRWHNQFGNNAMVKEMNERLDKLERSNAASQIEK